MFLNELALVDWGSFASLDDVDKMEIFWTREINRCLDEIAPWKVRKVKQKRFSLPSEVQFEIKKKKELQKRHQINVQNGTVDFELQKQLKKQCNYCNKLTKKAVRSKVGKNVTNKSSIKEVWNCINDILKPKSMNSENMKIETDGYLIEEPQE